MPTLTKAPSHHTKQNNNKKERMKIYNSPRWESLRKTKLQQQPLCEVCLLSGVVSIAEDVHHVVSFMQFSGQKRYDVAFNFDNLQSICKRCHGKEHSNNHT